MRGKPPHPAPQGAGIRITPADAGKTAKNTSGTSKNEDHPRGCGENFRAGGKAQCPAGSPPRMRGKPASRVPSSSSDRITPADAGKTRYSADTLDVYQDHPRGCGENTICGYRRLPAPGSPPRMRGKPHTDAAAIRPTGITPADAGKTSDSNAVYGASKDHPRGCGENYLAAFQAVREQGSPPRMRGKPV